MSEAIDRSRESERVEAVDELAGLFSDTEIDPSRETEGGNTEINRSREITEEMVAQMWEGLSDVEKKFVDCPQEQFDSI